MRPDRSGEPSGVLEQDGGHDTEQEQTGELQELEVRDREHQRRRNDRKTDGHAVMRCLHVANAPVEQAPIDDLFGERGHDHRHRNEGDDVDRAVDVGDEIIGNLTDVLALHNEPHDFVQRNKHELGGDADDKTERYIDHSHRPAEVPTPVKAVAAIEERHADEPDPQRKVQQRQGKSGRAEIVQEKALAELHCGTACFGADRASDVEFPPLCRNDRAADKNRQDETAPERNDGEDDQPRWRVRLRFVHLTGVAQADRLDSVSHQNLGLGCSAIAQRPTLGWLGSIGVAATEIVVGWAVDGLKFIKPHLATAVVEREGGVSILAAAGSGTTTVHNCESNPNMRSRRGATTAL